VLYEMLAGEPPFTGPTAQAIIAKRFKGAVPSVRDMRGAVPEGVDRAIKQALALVPADRFGSTAEFARALAAGMGPVSMAFVTQATPPDATTVSTSAPSGARPNRAMAIAFVLGLAVMASTGMLVWQRNHRATEPSTDGIQRLAVLPFQNLGSPDDAYFADGITDEVRGKLAAIPGLQVTASSSSSQYKGSTASPQQIGQELGVQYLLVGKVRWEKGAAGQNRVRVSPELVQVATASTKWQQPFDAALTDVFQVQADIAGRVADALDLALGSPQRQALGARPTANLEAYDAFLKGEAASDRIGTIDPARLKAAIGYYERAISLDSTFALAWAQLSRTYTAQYQAISATAAAAEGAKRGAERAAALAPGSAETQLALGDYYVTILVDPNRALTAYETGVRAFPNNAELLAGAATAQTVLGHWDQAVPRLQRAVLLDPRTAWIGGSLANALLLLRRYAEAEEVCRRGLAANPGNLGLVEADLTISLMHGDTTEARARLQKGASGVDPEVVAAYFATYGDLYWVLDSAQQEALLGLGPSRYGDRGNWALVMAEVYGLRGEQTKSRTYADSARIAYEDQLRERPRDPLRHTLLGLSLAYLGRKAEAIREGQRGIELYPFEQSVGQSYVRHQLVRIYLLTNEFDEGLERLEPLLKMPYILTPGWLKIDPNFAPLRGNPRFERLANGTQA
jgi:TolB-like protein